MTRRNLKAALEKNGGAAAYVNSDMHDDMTVEEVKAAAFESRRNQDADINEKMANDNRRNTLLRKAGFDWFDIDDLHPHPDNAYSIDEESIKNLAGLIYKSRETQPLVIRETKDGLQILDGERRWRAHKLLAEKYKDSFWRMVPAHCHPLDSLSDEDALYILHSNNLGQRNLSPSERAMGFKVIADSLTEWRKNDKTLKGVKTKTYLAQQFGVSERTAATNLSIAKGLIPAGMNLLDGGEINKTQATELATLTKGQQAAVIEAIHEGGLSSAEKTDLIQAVKERGETIEKMGSSLKTAKPKKKKETDGYLKSARNALKRANRCQEEANLALIGEIKQLIKEIDSKQLTQ